MSRILWILLTVIGLCLSVSAHADGSEDIAALRQTVADLEAQLLDAMNHGDRANREALQQLQQDVTTLRKTIERVAVRPATDPNWDARLNELAAQVAALAERLDSLAVPVTDQTTTKFPCVTIVRPQSDEFAQNNIGSQSASMYTLHWTEVTADKDEEKSQYVSSIRHYQSAANAVADRALKHYQRLRTFNACPPAEKLRDELMSRPNSFCYLFPAAQTAQIKTYMDGNLAKAYTTYDYTRLSQQSSRSVGAFIDIATWGGTRLAASLVRREVENFIARHQHRACPQID